MAIPDFLTLGDNPALDFLNTVVRGEAGLQDLLQSDADVHAWLRAAGLPGRSGAAPFARGLLLQSAHALRAAIGKLVRQKKSGKRVDVGELNAFLEQSRYHLRIGREANGNLHVLRDYERATPAQLLTGVAVAAAELLADGDFQLVRKCESDACVLWFYDRTKSHRRRWCSTAVCGNRHKVASFRARRKSAGEIV
jgi:predicted RNA-binding Zn ribbon-like protein